MDVRFKKIIEVNRRLRKMNKSDLISVIFTMSPSPNKVKKAIDEVDSIKENILKALFNDKSRINS